MIVVKNNYGYTNSSILSKNTFNLANLKSLITLMNLINLTILSKANV